jgi:hypothetical protein
MEKRLEKFISQRQHHPHFDVAVRKHNSPCHHAKEVADVTAVVIIFIKAAMERPNPPFILAVVGERGRTKSSIPKNFAWRKLILN